MAAPSLDPERAREPSPADEAPVPTVSLTTTWLALQMFTCESVSFNKVATIRVECYSGSSGDFTGWHAGLAILILVSGVLFWLWGLPVVRYRQAVAVVRTHAQTLSAATGQDARAIQEEIIRSGMAPGEWAVAHDLDPITFRANPPHGPG